MLGHLFIGVFVVRRMRPIRGSVGRMRPTKQIDNILAYLPCTSTLIVQNTNIAISLINDMCAEKPQDEVTT